MTNTRTGEFAGKQISITLSATNPGGFSVNVSPQETDLAALLVAFDGPVTFEGKDLQIEIKKDSVKVKVANEALRGKNTVTVISPGGKTKTVDVLPGTPLSLDFGPLQNILMDDFPFDIDPPVMPPRKKNLPVKHNKLEPRYGIVYITAKSATEIHKLNTERIARSGYISHSTLPGVQIDYFKQDDCVFFDVMMSNNAAERLKQIVHTAVTECACRTLTFVIDEAHVANGEHNQISIVLSHFGYRSANGGTITVNGTDVALKVVANTATPTKKISQVMGTRSVLHIRAEPAEGYFGIELLLRSGRLINTEKGISAKDLAALLLSHPGYMPEGIIVLRLPSNKRNGKYATDLQHELRGKHIIRTFDAKSQNLKDFNEFVSSGRDARGRGAIAILKDGFSAGFTLDRTDCIAAWIDLHYNDFEAQNQSVGRICGYGKLHNTFPVVTDSNGLERYEECLVQYSQDLVPSLNVGFTSEKRAASKLKFHTSDTAKFVIGTRIDFEADFTKRAEAWPPELVNDNTNSNAVNHIVRHRADNLADFLLRPTTILRLRGWDLSVSDTDRGEDLTKAMCPRWFKTDGTPQDKVPAAEAFFASFRKLRARYKDELAAGKNVMWLSSENEIISKFEANDDVRGKNGNNGTTPMDARHADLKTAKTEDGVPNTFFDTEVGEVPEAMLELVRSRQAAINDWYEEEGAKDKIYDTAVLPAAKILYAMLTREETGIVLTSQMQAGKTGIMILFMHCIPFLNEYTEQNG